MEYNDILTDIANIHSRQGGPTHLLKSKQAKDARNEKINKVVDSASFGDVKSFVAYLIERYPGVVDESIEQNPSYKEHLVKLIGKKAKVQLSVADSASILMTKSGLSQREYLSVRSSLSKQNVFLASYEHVSTHLKSLNVGEIMHKVCNCTVNCMSVICSFRETLALVIKNEFWFSRMNFLDEDRSKRLCEKLKTISPMLYGNLDPTRKTIFIRMTGDNFRTSRKQYTEQVSFSLLNVNELLHSPYGQFVSTIYRGKETRESIEQHTHVYHNEVKEMLINGGDFITPSGSCEPFNIIPFLCADLSFLKDLLGRCSCTSLYGCFFCKKIISKWGEDISTKPEKMTMKEMCVYGCKGEEILGHNPDHSSPKFTQFQHNHFGQYNLPLFDSVELELLPPCGLHLILAHHRYLWEFLQSIIVKRNQQHLIPAAFKTIDCSYLSLQYSSYLESKSKNYDGNGKLKMIGEDCKKMEVHIDKFLSVFIPDGETINSKSCEYIKHILGLYRMLQDIALDIRSTSYNSERVSTFQARVQAFFKSFKKVSRDMHVNRKPYLHILRDHIGDYMHLWGELMDWGYGTFNCNAGEHLNKQIKSLEFDSSNLQDDRFIQIVRSFRLRQLIIQKR